MEIRNHLNSLPSLIPVEQNDRLLQLHNLLNLNEPRNHELRGQLMLLKAKAHLPLNELDRFIHAVASVVLKSSKNNRNWARVEEMWLRASGNRFLAGMRNNEVASLCDPGRDISEVITMGEYLGEGERASVYKCTIQNGEVFAVKIGKNKRDYEYGRLVDTPHIAKVFLRIEKKDKSYLFMEYISGTRFGDIYPQLSKG